jgi:hypothetical protein
MLKKMIVLASLILTASPIFSPLASAQESHPLTLGEIQAARSHLILDRATRNSVSIGIDIDSKDGKMPDGRACAVQFTIVSDTAGAVGPFFVVDISPVTGSVPSGFQVVLGDDVFGGGVESDEHLYTLKTKESALSISEGVSTKTYQYRYFENSTEVGSAICTVDYL